MATDENRQTNNLDVKTQASPEAPKIDAVTQAFEALARVKAEEKRKLDEAERIRAAQIVATPGQAGPASVGPPSSHLEITLVNPSIRKSRVHLGSYHVRSELGAPEDAKRFLHLLGFQSWTRPSSQPATSRPLVGALILLAAGSSLDFIATQFMAASGHIFTLASWSPVVSSLFLLPALALVLQTRRFIRWAIPLSFMSWLPLIYKLVTVYL